MRRGLLSDWLQCVREIERASHGPCVGAAIGFLDWWAELVMIAKEMETDRRCRIT